MIFLTATEDSLHRVKFTEKKFRYRLSTNVMHHDKIGEIDLHKQFICFSPFIIYSGVETTLLTENTRSVKSCHIKQSS